MTLSNSGRLGLLIAILCWSGPSLASLQITPVVGAIDCEGSLTTGGTLKKSIEQLVAGSGQVTVASMKDLLSSPSIPSDDPFLHFVRDTLRSAPSDARIDGATRSSVRHLLEKMNTGKIHVIFLGKGVRVKGQGMASASYSAIQRSYVVIPATIPIERAVIQRDGTLNDEFFLVLDKALLQSAAGGGLIELLHEIVHMADVDRLNAKLGQTRVLPKLLRAVGKDGDILIPQDNFSFFLEVRAYASEFRTLKNLGLYDQRSFETTIQLFLQDAISISGGRLGSDHPLVASGIFNKQQFSTSRFYEVADLFEKWLNSEPAPRGPGTK